MSLSIVIAMLISFGVTFVLTPKSIIFLERIGMRGTDVHKRERPLVAEMGGPAIIGGLLAGIFSYIFQAVFLAKSLPGLIDLFAAITTIIIISLVGIFDDLSTMMRRATGQFKRLGLKQWQKPLLTLPAAIPLMAIFAGVSTVSLPFLGPVELGFIYPLLLVPIGIVGASNAVNMLAGMNGLEAGMGTVLMTSLGLYALSNGEIGTAALALTMAASLTAFLVFNWYPAKIMPGDSVTYAIGAAVASVAIIGNMEKFAVLCFLPWFVEFILKSRKISTAESFGVLQPDGTLAAPYDNVYSMTHVIMKFGRFKEWQVSSILIGLETVICIAAFVLIRSGII